MKKAASEKVSLIRFFVTRKFWLNLLMAFALVGIIVFILVKYLEVFTHHGREVFVPDFSGNTLQTIDTKGFENTFSFVVIDSLYDENLLPGSVVMQNPIPGTRVKKGRRIYFTIVSSTPEMVIMPDLRDLTLRQAINVLEMTKLKTGKLIYQPSFDKNAVLAQFYLDDTIAPGETLVKGSVIDLVIGSGDRNYRIPVPFLIGKTREEAIYELNIAAFNLGKEIYMDSTLTGQMRVFLQEPSWDSELSHFPGDSIHLWYRSAEGFDFDDYVKSIERDSLSHDEVDSEKEFDY